MNNESKNSHKLKLWSLGLSETRSYRAQPSAVEFVIMANMSN